MDADRYNRRVDLDKIDSGPTCLYMVQMVEVGDTAEVLLYPDCEYCYMYRCDECHAVREKENERLSAMRRQGKGGMR